MGGAVTMAALAGPRPLRLQDHPGGTGHLGLPDDQRHRSIAPRCRRPRLAVRDGAPDGDQARRLRNRSALRRPADPLSSSASMQPTAGRTMTGLMAPAQAWVASYLLLFGSREGILDKGSIAQFLSMPPEGQRAETLRLALIGRVSSAVARLRPGRGVGRHCRLD
jgi:hypothetical protein